MLKKFFVGFILLLLASSSFAAKFVILPNIKTQYLLQTNANEALALQTKAIEIVKNNINLTPYRTVRIRLIYDDQNKVVALIAYLLSAEYKSVTLVRINLNNWNVTSIINDYHLQADDMKQSVTYNTLRKPQCPDNSVQFVIGNNFDGDASVEAEIQRIYTAAKNKGYNPYLMDVNNFDGPQPTVQAYEDWMSCKNVKGFYNESHGYEEGILLTDDDFTYKNVKKDLVGKLGHAVILFDSCLTFHNPLLDAMLNPKIGNTQQYVAGIISLPFGPSERTARCFWLNALDQQALTKDMLMQCAKENKLDIYGFGIDGNGSDHLTPAS